MAELDQHRPTTSAFHRRTMEESVVKVKRIQRFTRQFSIFVHCEEEKTPVKCDENKTSDEQDQIFKYPGNLRAVKRKRNPESLIKKIGVKRRVIEHQKSVYEDNSEIQEGKVDVEVDQTKNENEKK